MLNATGTFPEVFTKSACSQQNFINILQAEFLRLFYKGAVKILAILLAVSAVIFIGLTISSFDIMEGSLGQVNVANQYLSLLYVVIGIYIVCSVSREHEDKTTLASLMAVPDRTKLFIARITAWTLLAIATGALGYIVGFVALVPFQSKLVGSVVLSELAAGFGLSLVKCAFTGILCFSIATIFRRVGLGLLVYLVLELIGAMLIGMVAPMMPETIANIFAEVNKALPNSLMTALTASGEEASKEMPRVAITIVAWAVVSVGASFAVFQKVKK